MSKIVCQSHDCKIDLQKKRLKPTLSTKTPRKGAATAEIQYTRLYGERERERGGGERGGEGKGRGEEGRGGGVFQILTLKFIHVHIHNDSTANLLTTLASEFLKPYLSIRNTLQEGMIFIMYMLQTD